MARRVSGPGELSAPTTFPTPDGAAELDRWLRAGARELVDAVRTVGADQPVSNYLGVDLRAGFWPRRMAHEIAVHGADVALTVDEPFGLDAELAADAITKWLILINSAGAAAYRPELAQELRGNGQTLHCTLLTNPASASPESG